LPNGKKGIETILATGIFAAQEFELFDCGTKNIVVVEAPSHLDLQFSDSHYTGISFAGGWTTEINTPVAIDHTLVVTSRALRRGSPVQRFSHALRS
jgi:hypothetical protein